MARQGLQDYYRQALEKKRFRPAELKEFMEPVFREAGYRQPPNREKEPKILIIRDDAAGDFVLFSPFLREVRRIYKGAHITLLCSSRNRELAECCPYIDNLLRNEMLDTLPRFADASEMLQVSVAAAEKLLPYNFDLAFSPRLGLFSFSMVLAYMSGATEVVGFTENRDQPEAYLQPGWDVLMTVAVPAPLVPLHDVDRNLSMLEHLTKFPIFDRALEIWYTPQELEEARAMLEPLRRQGLTQFIAAVPVASLPMKEWPMERYTALFRQLLAEDDSLGIVAFGGPEERQRTEALAAELGERAISAAGRGGFRLSAALMHLMDVYIGNDTGLMHIAAACRLPILSVNCFPMGIEMGPMAIPIRFTPYQVPSVTVLPDQPLDDCDQINAYGCKREMEAHCILQVTLEAMRTGYEILRQRSQAGITKPMYIKV